MLARGYVTQLSVASLLCSSFSWRRAPWAPPKAFTRDFVLSYLASGTSGLTADRYLSSVRSSPGTGSFGRVPSCEHERRTHAVNVPTPQLNETLHRKLHRNNYEKCHENVQQIAKYSVQPTIQAVMQACIKLSKESSIVAYALMTNSPRTKPNRSRIFACGNRADRCRSGISRFLRPFIPVLAAFSPRFTLIGSQDVDVKSRPNLFIHSLIYLVAKICRLYRDHRIGSGTSLCRRTCKGKHSRSHRIYIAANIAVARNCYNSRRTAVYTSMRYAQSEHPRSTMKGPRLCSDLPFPPPLRSGAAPYSSRFTLIGSQDPDDKSLPNNFTHSTVKLWDTRLTSITAIVHAVRGLSAMRFRPCETKAVCVFLPDEKPFARMTVHKREGLICWFNTDDEMVDALPASLTSLLSRVLSEPRARQHSPSGVFSSWDP
ncbi:hypothetical protein PR048_029292 [Dryococelus australis]|uniref:Uncharacterized protein n=1 Tax=Dryococelus australis TaxID=614101 RepID=A0ABQ9GG35_9NEOP|nr:hypothetical protein PR048_029292 [Dryococelus australis]